MADPDNTAASRDVQDQVAVGGAPAPVLDDAPARLRYRSDAPDDGPLVSLADFLASSNAGAVRLDPADDARALLPHLSRLRLVEVSFPRFRDGRGYSSARILREHGYVGELRAAGDINEDQMLFLRRIGFDSFVPDRALDTGVIERALARYPHVYMKSSDGLKPAWALRHG
ncbi:DUF934 domain-containing protein [Polymorphobacter sp.]|uniref:DUF934 domain-containing protein n=1 Tax=Polymorphobacter sp. TaxID=1909290 RepID=UPI003F71E3B0